MKLIIAMTGASGSIYGTRLLEFLKERQDVETHLIISNAAEGVIPYETDYENIEQVKNLADYCYQNDDLAASVSSGSFLTSGMIVIPCSAKTLSAVANSYGENLIARTCDVSLKERRKLILPMGNCASRAGKINVFHPTLKKIHWAQHDRKTVWIVATFSTEYQFEITSSPYQYRVCLPFCNPQSRQKDGLGKIRKSKKMMFLLNGILFQIPLKVCH